MKFFLTLMLRALLPTIYTTVRVSILGTLPSDDAINIASQLMWVNVLLEVVEEGLLQPLYHCLGSSVGDGEAIKNKMKTGFLVCGVIYVTFSSLVSIFAPQLVDFMAQTATLTNDTVVFIRLELIATIFDGLGKFFLLLMILSQLNRHILIAKFLEMIVSILFDVFLVSRMPYSAQIGVNGIAFSRIASTFLVLMYSSRVCWIHFKLKISDVAHGYDFSWYRVWSRIGVFSMLDSLVRNVTYMIIVVRAMNMLQNQSIYWLANVFIWNWLLLPVTALAEVLKREISVEKRSPYAQKLSAFFFIAIVILLTWLVTFPSWPSFVRFILQASNPDQVIQLITLLIHGYALFAFSSLFIAIFYGIGKTEHLFINSLVVNACLSVAFAIMMRTDLIAVSVQNVALIFSTGLCIGFFVLLTQFLFVLRKTKFMM